MKRPRAAPKDSAAGRGRALLLAFSAALALLMFMIAVTYLGNLELQSLVDDEQAAFERNIDEQSSSLNRVILAVGDLLLASAQQGAAGGDFEGLLALGQATVNHAGIPSVLESSFLARILGEDPLFLADRLAEANGRYRSRVEAMSRLIESVASAGEGPEGRALLEDFLRAAAEFKGELRQDSALLIQVVGAYHAANRRSLVHLHGHINQNLVELSLLAALLVGVSIAYFRSRLSIERELRDHRDHLSELVAIRTEELGATNARLRETIGEKEVLIKEVYHRVKNNLTMVAGLVALQRTDTKVENMEAAFEKLSQRIGAISLIHEKLYRSADLANVAFGDYIRDLCNTLIYSLSSNPAAISFELDSPDLRFSPDTLIPLGLIVTELVTNSLKYAFRNRARGRIGITLARKEEAYLLEVRDDGTPPEDEKKILESGSLGAVLVANLVRQIGGTMELDLRGGTGVLISFPGEL
jgi:two-component sensor histidine kinase